MATRKAYASLAWLSSHLPYYGWFTGEIYGTPTLSVGACSFDFGVDAIYAGAIWTNRPTSAGMSYSLLGVNSLTVTDHASWADGTRRKMFHYAGLEIFAKKSGSNYVIEVESGAIVTGTTLLSFGTAYNISVSRQIASPTRGRVWIGSTLEIDSSSFTVGATPNTVILSREHTDPTNGSFSVREVLAVFSDTDERIDASTLNGQELVVSGNGTSYNEYYADEAGAPPTAPRHDSVDEDPPDGDTTFLDSRTDANTTDRQTFTTTNITMANPEVVVLFDWARTTIAAKTLSPYGMSTDGGTTNKEEVQTNYGPVDDYTPQRAVFWRAPDGSPWSQAGLNSWEPGTRATRGANAVAWRNTAIHAEAMGVDYIALPAAADRRRALAQVI